MTKLKVLAEKRPNEILTPVRVACVSAFFSSIAAIAASINAYSSSASVSNYLRQEAQRGTLINCSEVISTAAILKLALYKKCIPNPNNTTGFSCLFETSSDLLPVADPLFKSLADFNSKVSILEITWPIDAPLLLRRLNDVAERIVRTRLQGDGGLSLQGHLEAFDNLLVSLIGACRKIAVKGGLGVPKVFEEEDTAAEKK